MQYEAQTQLDNIVCSAAIFLPGCSKKDFPVVLGWEKGKANCLLYYGFYAPTGDFNPTVLNPGLSGSHQIQAGASYSFDKRKLWNTSLLSTWEILPKKLAESENAALTTPMSFTGTAVPVVSSI